MLLDECWLTMGGFLENSGMCLEYSGMLRLFRELARNWSNLTLLQDRSLVPDAENCRDSARSHANCKMPDTRPRFHMQMSWESRDCCKIDDYQ